MRICLYCIVTLLRGKDPKKGFNDMDYLVFTSITTYPEELFMIMLVAAAAAAAIASKVP